MLQREPETRRFNEGAAGGDDGSKPASHQGLVPEQTLQGQKEGYPDEATAAAGEGLFQWNVTNFTLTYVYILFVYLSK